MEMLFTAFANSQEMPLATLREEDDEVYSILSRRALQQHFAIHRDSNTNIPKIAEYLARFRQNIVLFLYSGHADKDALLLDGERAHASGIARLLGQCPRLKLIILNGCSTARQVEQLLALENHPVVIATSAPVGDRTAAQFSISFFQSLSEDHATIREAFEVAIGAAQTAAEGELPVSRGATFSASSQEAPVWGLFYKSEGNLDWKLPAAAEQMELADYVPNEYLIVHMLEALAPYVPEAAGLLDREEEGLSQVNLSDQREVILKSLPHPISEQIRKLLVQESATDKAVFFDKPGAPRLRQIVLTYDTVIELMAFIMLGQLWDALNARTDLNIPPDLGRVIRNFLTMQREERVHYEYFPLIRTVLSILHENEIPCFVKELSEEQKLFDETSDCYVACRFMELLKDKLKTPGVIDELEARQLCVPAEEKLAGVLGRLAFIARYTLTSVKDIDVVKFRHLKTPRFKHKLVKLIQRLGGLAEEEKMLEDFMDSSSVLLMSENGREPSFLNLSPFLIDQNAFDEKAGIAKLYFFHHYEKDTDAICFKHIYKPKDRPLVIEKQPHLRVVKAQFNSFAKLIFKTSLREAV